MNSQPGLFPFGFLTHFVAKPSTLKGIIYSFGILHLVLCPSIVSCQNRWRQSEFILGTFWDPPVHIEPRYLDSDLRGFRLARDAGFNLLTGTQIEPNIDRSFDGMKCALKLAWQTGLQYLVADERFYPAYGCIFDKSKAKELVDAYKKLPASLRSAMFGYNLCDEPYFEQDHFKSISQWKWLIETSDPSKLVYLNLASSYAPSYNWGGFRGGNEDRVLDANERDEYESYLSLYIDNLRPTVISFDHYPFFADGTIRRDYYYNLSVIRRKAGKRPFWAYPMTVAQALPIPEPAPVITTARSFNFMVAFLD